MPFSTVFGSCVSCNKFISFNPDHVPSIILEGEREPICQLCHEKWNEIHRTSKGLAEVPLHPLAYEPEEG